MITMTIWWVGIILGALVVFRGLRQKLFQRYPFFYSYLALVCVVDILRFFAHRADAKLYFKVYWSTQYLSLLIGSTVIFELYRIGLRAYPGTAKMARGLLLIVFAAIIAKVLANPTGEIFVWFVGVAEQLERSLRIVQASAMLVLVALCIWHAIPLGRNLKGIVSGYGLFVCMSILQLSAVPYLLNYVTPMWPYLQPCSWLLVLGIWATTLWSSDSVTEQRVSSENGRDYEALAASTGELLEQARARMGTAVRP